MQEIMFNMINFKDKETGKYLSFPTVKGDKGDAGKSAYEIAVKLGYSGTESEWIESLKYVSSPEYDTLMESLTSKESSAVAAASAAMSSAQAAKDYADSMAGLKGFEVVILENGEYENGIPTITDPKESTFYFVPSGNGGNNNYNEYIYVNNSWEMVGAEKVNLEPYALKTDLNDYAKTEALDDYVKTEVLDDYAQTSALDGYVKTEALDDYVKSETLDNYVENGTLDNYVQSSTLEDYATVESLDDYATKEDLKDYAKTSDYTTTTDLANNYALKTELPTTEEKAAWNAKYDLPETGITEEELSAEVRVKLNSFFEADPVDKDLLSAYAMKTELLDYQKKLDMKDYALKTDLNSYATTASLDDYAKTEDLDDYATVSSLNDYALKTDLNNYATAASLDDYVKTEDIDDLVDLSVLDNYALKTDLDNLVESSTLEDYALKTELSTAEKRAEWDAKYDKPKDGIPLTDLSQDVQDVINDPKIEIDDTLTVEGAAADAKTTGDILETKLGPDDIVKFIQWDNAVEGITMSTTTNIVALTEAEYEGLKVKIPNTYYFIYEEDVEDDYSRRKTIR